ncbi:YueH family protein [Staphylococcus xylosus]|uniref:YueH family protein n=1 Tax=Staphylococcus xylosus TaxID=1288 RepID=UPI003F57DBC3
MKVKKINFNDIQANVYIYENVVEQLFLIAMPEINWSLEVESILNEDDMKEELVIHLFTLLDESTASDFADDIVKWILEN